MRNRSFILPLLGIAAMVGAMLSCKHTPVVKPEASTGYPKAIEDIIITKCATSGCHTDQSRIGAAGLSLTSWSKLFEGSRGGAVVIPYRPDYSTLLYYTNTDSSKGIILKPTMPYNAAPLTPAEYETLKTWIAAGAPNKDGSVKFSDSASTRQKFFTANQGCDVATVFDAQSMLAMRVVNIGSIAGQIESAHQIKASPNNAFFCVCFLGGPKFQKFSLTTYEKLGEVEIGSGSWNTFSISEDSKRAYTFDLNSGKLAIIDLERMTAQIESISFLQPHGTALDRGSQNLYVTGQRGNFIYKLPTSLGRYEVITLNKQPQSVMSSLDPHEIHFNPDYSKYFLTCQGTNEVRVMNTEKDTLMAVIPVGGFPQEMGFSKRYPYLFVSCMEDVSTFPGKRGAVYVVNYNDHTVVTKIYAGHQSHGIAVDDVHGRVYITNRNVSSGGPAPHHASQCGGRNGYITAIDMKTLELIPEYKAEVSVDPYGLGITN